jgi:hypothetical protein
VPNEGGHTLDFEFRAQSLPTPKLGDCPTPEVPRIHPLKLSEKPRARLERSPADPREALLGLFVPPIAAESGLRALLEPFSDSFRETVRRGVLRQRLGTLPSMRRAYQTDLSDAKWSYIEPHMPTPKGTGRPRIPLSARARLLGGGTLQAEDEEDAAKGGSHLGSLSRVYPAHRSGGKAPNPGDDGPEESRGVPTRMVAVSSGSPGAVARRSHEAAHRAKGAAYHDTPSGREPELAESSEASAPTIPVQANNETGLLTDA